jgi:hypothetical protein
VQTDSAVRSSDPLYLLTVHDVDRCLQRNALECGIVDISDWRYVLHKRHYDVYEAADCSKLVGVVQSLLPLISGRCLNEVLCPTNFMVQTDRRIQKSGGSSMSTVIVRAASGATRYGRYLSKSKKEE